MELMYNEDYPSGLSLLNGKMVGSFDKSTGYYKVTYKGKRYHSHRVIAHLLLGLDLADGSVVVDHKDKDKSNNKVGNLRLVTWADNCRNRTLDSRNKSGLIGVSMSRGKFLATIRAYGKSKHLGRFDNLFDAACARKSAELLHYNLPEV